MSNQKGAISKTVLEPFQNKFPPLSLYYTEQSTANSNSFKIAQKTAFEAEGRLYTTGKVIQRLFIIGLLSYFFVKKIPLSRRVGYVMGG